jgi:transposase
MAAQALADAQKKARREGRTILFIDETGLSQRPTRVRTWAPKGCTPVLRYSFNWKQLTVIAALGARNFYFRLVQGPIQKRQIVEFLKTLQRQIGGRLLIIWDGLPQHRSRVVADYLGSTNGKVVMEYLPGYAPELNPSEYIWAYMKQHELANFCRDTISEVQAFAARRLKSMQRRCGLIASFWKQSSLKI